MLIFPKFVFVFAIICSNVYTIVNELNWKKIVENDYKHLYFTKNIYVYKIIAYRIMLKFLIQVNMKNKEEQYACMKNFINNLSLRQDNWLYYKLKSLSLELIWHPWETSSLKTKTVLICFWKFILVFSS